MKQSIKTGLTFGLTSGVITTLGLIVGLEAGTGSKSIIIGGILTIAIADSFSDALGIHIAEEAKNNSSRNIWEATIVTFLAKFLFALTFILPIYFLKLDQAIIVSIIWGLLTLSYLSYRIAKSRGESPYKIILEHVLIATFVIFATHHVGRFISAFIA